MAKPLRATDRRKGKIRKPLSDQNSTGQGTPLLSVFSDRRHPNGTAPRAR